MSTEDDPMRVAIAGGKRAGKTHDGACKAAGMILAREIVDAIELFVNKVPDSVLMALPKHDFSMVIASGLQTFAVVWMATARMQELKLPGELPELGVTSEELEAIKRDAVCDVLNKVVKLIETKTKERDAAERSIAKEGD